MKLSIIIVNYNVRYFLHQCLDSVFRSETNFDFEVIVVDNASADDSMEMVKTDFPQVKCIENKENTGFSVANNQGIQLSTAEYVLLLNPDTAIDQNCLQAAVDFMDAHEQAGALGIRMLDGTGEFLPESKRGLPTPWVAFYKIFGLSRIFKSSKKFGKYHLSYLNQEEVHEIDVLAGAFMLMRRTALDKSGLLDETFFMYGEDIDLSYRIQQAGYTNHYFPHHPIIHYKGESTKRGSLNYVRVFYQAMRIFADKHFQGSQGFFYRLAIRLAINLRAALAIFNRVYNALALPVIDALILFIGMFWAKTYWENNHRYIEGGQYPEAFMQIAVPAYILVWLGSVYISGGYDKPVRLKALIRGLGLGSVLLFAMYGFLPEDWRFSRALIALGAAWALMVIPIHRLVLDALPFFKFKLSGSDRNRSLVITTLEREEFIQATLRKVHYQPDFLALVSCSPPPLEKPDFIAGLDEIEDAIQSYDINELVFDAEVLDYQTIIQEMKKTAHLGLKVKIIPRKAEYLIGSDRADAAGDLYHAASNRLVQPGPRRAKRIFDLLICIPILLSIPLQKRPGRAIGNLVRLVFGNRTLVSTRFVSSSLSRDGILQVRYSSSSPKGKIQFFALERDYLKQYTPAEDFRIYLAQWRDL